MKVLIPFSQKNLQQHEKPQFSGKGLCWNLPQNLGYYQPPHQPPYQPPLPWNWKGKRVYSSASVQTCMKNNKNKGNHSKTICIFRSHCYCDNSSNLYSNRLLPKIQHCLSKIRLITTACD